MGVLRPVLGTRDDLPDLRTMSYAASHDLGFRVQGLGSTTMGY